jgi:hypothetical protein
LADWDAVMKDPTLVMLAHPGYVLKFDCYKFADENYDRVAEEIKEGRTLKDFDDPQHFQKMTINSVEEIGIA